MVKCIDIMAAKEAEDRDLAPAQSVDEAAALASTLGWNDYMLEVCSPLRHHQPLLTVDVL
jgi:hypothetical protein